jgi:EpsI family protein
LRVSLRWQINGPNGVARDVWQWYWVNGKLVGGATQAKIETMKAKLLGGPTTAATLIVSTERLDPATPATDGLQAFMDAWGPPEARLPEALQPSRSNHSGGGE